MRGNNRSVGTSAPYMYPYVQPVSTLVSICHHFMCVVTKWLRNPGTYLKMLLVCGIRVTDRIWVYMYHGKSCPLARFLYKNGKSFGPSEKATTPPYEWLAYAHRAAVLGPYLRPVPVTNRTEHFSRAISITERRALEPAGDPRAF